MLLLVGATADSCVLCVLCRVFMIRTAALVKICWEVLPAERYSLQKKTAERYSLSPLRLARLCQVLIVMLPHRRIGRLHDESARTVLEKAFVHASGWQANQSPLRAKAFIISLPVPSVGPVAPALHGETAVDVAAPCCGDRNLGTFLSGSRPVYRNTGSCFLQRATPRRELLLALRHRGMLGDRIVPTKRPKHCTKPAVQSCP